MRLFILLVLVSTTCFARQYTINQMTLEPGYEAIFNLVNTNDKSFRVALDCQSYFHKIDAFDKNDFKIMENYISSGECYYLWENISSCIETTGSKCIDSEHLFNDSCSCL